jgi:hypothetical protein
MRIIRTEYYFDKFQVDWKGDFASAAENPNIAFAWIIADAPVAAADVPNFHVVDSSPVSKLEDEERENLIRCMNVFLTSKSDGMVNAVPFSDQQTPSPANRQLIEECLESTVVIEQSPIEELSMQQLVARATSWSLGTYLGVTAAASSPALAVITIPLGVIIMGTAAGISRGLEAGLHRAIERRLVGPRQRSPSAPEKTKPKRRSRRGGGSPQAVGS